MAEDRERSEHDDMKVRSSKPRKQRKALYGAPWHSRRRALSASLSEELREKYSKRSFPVRKGDTVRVMRGDHAGEEGSIAKVLYAKRRIHIENIKREKVDGSTVLIPIHPSKVRVVKLNLDDKLRKEALERRAS